jgi:hypothetical protein
MRKLFFIVSIGLVAFVAGLNHHLRRPSLAGQSHASVSRAAGATVPSPSSISVASPVKLAAQHIPATAPGERPKPSSPSPRIPLEFEANRGQAPDQYAYVAHGPTYSLGLSVREIALSLHRPQAVSQRYTAHPALDQQASEKTSASQLYLRLLGASKTATVAGADPRPGISNYFIGNDPARWRTNVPHFGTVKIAAAYPGVDLVFYGNPQQLEYDFQVAPGTDPAVIRLAANGARSAALDRDGNLILGTAAGEVQLKHPDAYQEIDGASRPVRSEFRLEAANTVQFRVGEYDHTKPLIIDPVLLYGVAIGGSNGNQGVGMDIDAAGNAYVTGSTCSTDFPSTAGNFATIHTNAAISGCQDAFVFKLDPTASTLIYSDYIGGSVLQTGAHIAVDSSGDAFVTGATGSLNFPLVNNIGPASPLPCGLARMGFSCPTGFIFKLSPDGSQLLFSSLLGGSQTAAGFQAKLNPVTGDLLVLGDTNSSNFIPAPTSLQTAYSGGTCANSIPCYNAVLLGLNPATGAFKYGTFLGSAQSALASGLAFDSGGDIYLTGSATLPLSSSLGPVTNSYAPNGAADSGTDVLVARLHLTGTTLSVVYLTVIEGELDDGGSGIALDASGNAYVIGSTESAHLPVTTGAFQSAYTNTSGGSCMWQTLVSPVLPNSCGSAFVAKLGPTGALSFLTYLGGSNQTWGQAIGVDSLGNIWLTGVTSAQDFPFSADAYMLANIGAFSPFLAEMSNNGSQLPFATLIAANFGQSTDIKIDSANNIYVTGFASTVLTTPNVYPPDASAFSPVFVQKWSPGAQPTLQLSSTSLTFPPTPYGGISAAQTVTAQNTGTAPLQLSVQLETDSYDASLPSGFLESDNCGSSLAAGASCSITATFEPTPPGPNCVIANGCQPGSGIIVIQNNAATGPQTISLSGVSGHGAAAFVSPNPIVFPPQAAGTTSAGTYVEVESEGDVSLTVGNVSIGGPNASDFQITSIGTCNNPVPLGEIGCSLQVAFSPSASATGTRTATLIVADNAGDSPQSAPMSGVVTGPGASLIVTPGPLSLGEAAIGAPSSSSQADVYITNPSTNTAVQITSLTLAGTNAADFSVTTGSCSFSGLPFTVAASASCFLPVKFLPSGGTHGLRTATLTIATNPAISGLPVIGLSGDAVTNTDGSLSLISVPSPQDFGSVQVGQSTLPGQNLIAISAQSPIPCAGGATSCGGPLTISSFATGNGDYTVVSEPSAAYCTNPPLTIPAGGYGCDFQIIFSPSTAGNRNTTLSIISNDPMGPTVIPLFGTGLALPLGSLSLTQLAFGNSAIGVASPPLTVTLQNIGQSNLTFSGATASANFSVASNNCPASLAPNASCTLEISFTPSSAGAFTGTMTITDNDYYGSQQTVALSGTGATGPQLRLSATSFNFGNQGVNTASLAQPLTLTNTGDTVITFPENAFRASMDYFVQDTSCGSTLATGASCIVNIQFKPSISFLDPGSLFITDNAHGNPQAVALVGTGTTADGTPTISLTSSVNPSAPGVSVTFTATVAGSNPSLPVPTGSVTFDDYFSPVGLVALNGSGQAAFTTSTLTVGTHSINAVYSGNAGYASVYSTVLTEVVNPSSNVSTTTSVISSINPAIFGQSVVFTATITGAGGPTPTGNVIFLDGTTTLETVALNGASQALFATSSLSAGSHSITAMYAGNANYAGSTSSLLTQVVNASTGIGTTTTLASSSNPSSAAQSVVFTASVVGVGGNVPTPTGTVTFVIGTTTLGTVVLNGTAQASFTASSLAPGAYSITAIYSGDETYAASASTAITQMTLSPPFIWLANGNQTLSKVSTGGIGFSPPSGYPGGGSGLAIDGFGDAWSGGNGTVTMLNEAGGGSQAFSGGGIATPVSIAIAGDGSVWIANTNSTLANLANNGTPLSPNTGYSGGGLDTPTGLAIDSSGNVWVPNTGDSSLTEFVGAAAPVVTPLATAVKNANQGGQP